MLKELTISDFKLRYNGSFIGIFWFVIKPLSMLTVLYIIFGLVLKTGIQNYVPFLFIGIIFWNFFVESTTMSMDNILDKKMIIRAIYLPRQLLVLSSTLNAFMSLAINLVLLFAMLALFKIHLGFTAFAAFLLLAMLLVFSLGVSYLLAALYVKYRDISHVWQVILQLGFWITPVIYSTTMIPKIYLDAYMLNPLAWIIASARDALIYDSLSMKGFLAIAAICIAIYIVGYYTYCAKSKYFAEEL
jgi:ABC-type polysaccharide/polyol phosphate export permease